ncbi:MAG: hypothetical protein EHM83_02280 [Burkholderiales bacterium]|nr:MAG: hypothetical protein EHM83_02280 [Burkholderiales bacterium]
MDHGQRLREAAQEVTRVRAASATDPSIRSWVHAVKTWQAHRLARTHRDLLTEPRHVPAARFFLEDLYGAKDFSQRDAELARIVPMMARLLPDAALATIADAVEMDALSERLDLALARRLREPDAPAIDEAAYADAYRAAGSRSEREHQIELIVTVGRSLDRLVRHPMLGHLLNAMGGPARLAGLSEMHDFLARGFEAFRSMGGASEFLARIERRERQILEALYAGASANWSEDPPASP